MTDENKDTAVDPEIEDHWVKFQQKFGERVDSLKTKGSSILRRDEAEAPDSQNMRCVCSIPEQPGEVDSREPDSGAANRPIPNNPIDPDYIDPDRNPTDSNKPSLLRASDSRNSPAVKDLQEPITHRGESFLPVPGSSGFAGMPQGVISDGPSRNAVELLKGIKEGVITAESLDMEERRVVVKALKDSGQTQDSIAELLKVCRKTIVNDYKWLREQSALHVVALDQYLLAGEVYELAQTLVRRALSEKKFRTASRVMKDMVEMLQDLGVMYRAPRQTIAGNINLYGKMKQAGYMRYSRVIEGEQDGVVNVLDKLMEAIASPDACNPFG